MPELGLAIGSQVDNKGRIRQEAEQSSALAQEVGAYREALTEVAEQALAADAELRRRHPDQELPPLHPAEEPPMPTPESTTDPTARRVGDMGPGPGAELSQPDAMQDVTAALEAARKPEMILAQRTGVEPDSDDVMRRREAEARREAERRRSAIRQDPAPSRREAWLKLEEPGTGGGAVTSSQSEDEIPHCGIGSGAMQVASAISHAGLRVGDLDGRQGHNKFVVMSADTTFCQVLARMDPPEYS